MVTSIFSFSNNIFYRSKDIFHYLSHINPSQKQQILGPSKLKEFADNNIRFDENGGKFYKRVENTGQRMNYSLRVISPFPTVFTKDLYCRQAKTRACLGKG